MAIKSTYNPIEFPKGRGAVIKKFSKLILKNYKEYEFFDFDDVIKSFNLSNEEKKQFKAVKDDVKRSLISSNRITKNEPRNKYQVLPKVKTPIIKLIPIGIPIISLIVAIVFGYLNYN